MGDSKEPREPGLRYEAWIELNPEAVEIRRKEGTLRRFIRDEVYTFTEHMLVEMHANNEDYGLGFDYRISAIPKKK